MNTEENRKQYQQKIKELTQVCRNKRQTTEKLISRVDDYFTNKKIRNLYEKKEIIIWTNDVLQKQKWPTAGELRWGQYFHKIFLTKMSKTIEQNFKVGNQKQTKHARRVSATQ